MNIHKNDDLRKEMSIIMLVCLSCQFFYSHSSIAFSSSATMRLTFLVLCEMSLQILNVFPWTLEQIISP